MVMNCCDKGNSMKRIAIILLICVSICVNAYAVYDESNTLESQIIIQLEKYSILYNFFPESFGWREIIGAHSLYSIIRGSSEYNTSSLLEDIEEDKARTTIKLLVNTITEQATDMEEAYSKWLKDEITDQECADKLIKLVDVFLKNQ